MEIRLQEAPFELDGKTYKLRCNMNVLADVQAAHDGNLQEIVGKSSSLASVLEFTAAMLNDYADEQAWTERYEAKTLGRTLSWGKMQEIAKLAPGLVLSALKTNEPEAPPKNE